MGATVPKFVAAASKPVSIHAPVMGATIHACPKDGDEYVSIHAPVMGATQSNIATESIKTFQSTHP